MSQDPLQRIFFFIFKETRHHYRKFRKYRKEMEKMSSTPWSRTVEWSSRDSALSFPRRLQFGQRYLLASGCCYFTAPQGRPGPDHLRKALGSRNHRVQLHTPPSLPAFHCSRNGTPAFQSNVPLSLGLTRETSSRTSLELTGPLICEPAIQRVVSPGRPSAHRGRASPWGL